jgi:DNA helicase-2/ATP-dependent DNA helicase PcrA
LLTPTKQQKAVIRHTEGPLLVIAGPGAGKTYTLVERIVHLVAEKKVSPENMLVATFTEKAAAELITRITHRLLSQNIVVNMDDMLIGTLHSVCLRFLEKYREFSRLKKNYAVMDQFDQSFFIFQRLREFEEVAPLTALLGDRQTARWNRAGELCSWLNKLSEEMVDPGKLKESDNATVHALGAWYEHYLNLLEKENLLDFSVIQLEAVKLLKNNPDKVLAALQEKIQYIMVDEYQDTNTVQECLLFTLLNQRQNICVVGDDDQGLYRFRGATIRNILEFPDKFPKNKCAVHKIETNYRSDPGIIEFYNSWMDGSIDNFSWRENDQAFRYAKNIIPAKDKKAFASPVIKISGESEQGWHEEISAFLQKLKEKHITNWNQITFLFKSVRGDKVRALAQFLEENNVPVYAPRSNLFFEREEVRLMVGVFMFLLPHFRKIREDWARRYPPLPVWEYYDQCLADLAGELRKKDNQELLVWLRHRVREIQGTAVSNKPLDYNFSMFFYMLIQFPLFSRFLSLHERDADERPARNLAILSQLLVKFEYLYHIQVFHPTFLNKNTGDFFNHFLRYLADGGIAEFEDADDTLPEGAVAFMTIHQAKGLEFPVTIVGSLYDRPRKQFTDLDGILQNEYYSRKPFEPLEAVKVYDFKRLYYTAFSRAKNLLVLSSREESKVRGGLKIPTPWFLPFYQHLPLWRDVDFAKLRVEPVRSQALKGKYSYTSHVLVYENCPRQYQFFKHWEFSPVREGPMLFGQLVHQTIEDIHKTVLNGRPEAVTEANIERWFDVNYANLSHKERIYLAPRVKDVALEHVLRYAEHKGGNWDDIRATEIDVSLVKDDYILTGKIDLIKGRGDTVEIVDFKATPKLDQYGEREQIDRYRRQLEIYAHLVEQRYGLTVSAMNLYYTGEESGVPVHRFPYAAKSVDKTIAEVDAVVERMERKDFAVKERKPKRCKECELQPYCDRNM